ncbi:Tumor necrosis factor [Varanus komodoensis]|uniref:tumor necrosis factor n=1 Tax=Varanus komodoensis TaxID=61221 RepID=UPI001CF778E2|nr:tumor necrosis factor [Varanus komodoensis]KAF7236092.1 Tumor necrosis factor [Varanus komodoensis]
MSSEHLVYDLEKGSRVILVDKSLRKEGPWKCLSICSFVLLIGATLLFTLLQFGAFRQSETEENRNPLSEGLPATMKVQALVSRKPAAHAIANLSRHNQLLWTTKVAPSMLENGMQLNENDNSLVVPSTGLYFIYSQLLFHGKGCTSPVLLTHTISWQSAQFNTEVDLLKSMKTVCEGGRDPPSHSKLWFESIYQGAVFKLHKGDRLWSKTDLPHHLDLTRSGQIYFGVIGM